MEWHSHECDATGMIRLSRDNYLDVVIRDWLERLCLFSGRKVGRLIIKSLRYLLLYEFMIETLWLTNDKTIRQQRDVLEASNISWFVDFDADQYYYYYYQITSILSSYFMYN